MAAYLKEGEPATTPDIHPRLECMSGGLSDGGWVANWWYVSQRNFYPVDSAQRGVGAAPRGMDDRHIGTIDGLEVKGSRKREPAL